MRRPSARDLPDGLFGVATRVARRLGEAGRRAYLVGGCVRDLALEVVPKDVDLATAATPDEIEALFARTAAVGRAFGTVLVIDQGAEVQVTTFRSEGGYSDARHPDEVRFSETPEEDARRRDFTCNALYLDPLTDELLDPTGGLADLEAGVLRCVGDAERRFAEDGLRLLRMARFAAAYDLAIEAPTLAAARASAASLRGVSPERVYGELRRVCERSGAARAFRCLAEAGLLQRALPGLEQEGLEERLAVLDALPDGAELAVWLAAVSGGEAEIVAGLRGPRAVSDRVRRLSELRASFASLPAGSRAARVRLVRDEAWPDFAVLERARGELGEPLEDLAAFGAALSEAERFPRPLLTSEDLAAAGFPRGPRWGELLHDAETLQLDRELKTRAAALAWLAAQDGGKTRRNA